MDVISIASLCLHALTVTIAVLALARTRHSRVSNVVRSDLNKIEARSEVWRASTITLRQQVESAIDRLESKRRSLAATESRLAAREGSEIEKAEAEVERERDGNGEDVPMDRATARRLKREHVEA